ncbi:unnamed protein product [Rhizoctonia solani]|uniref:Protein kinase domain-containing protein n=1 Tax=Rhizoctonia solani TaxID=456999 RepID=A0A8H3GC07_9AGAM|nr:unnamed protein product [Rhizoctonia solani]
MFRRNRTSRKSEIQVVINERQSIISGSMSASEILVHLGRHGCEDVTNRLELSNIGRSAIFSGGFGDVYRGALRTGDRVAIKYLRMLVTADDSGEKQLKRTAHELYIWSKCRHVNILELIGVAQHNNQIAMVSPWMENGNMNWYLNQHPLTDRYSLCSQIADAVAYLRNNGIVHGDIKGANILVSGDHVPKLTDFGSSNIRKYTLGFTTSTTGPHTTLRWTAPEIFMEETKHTFEGDVYALGMTILEAFTESIPYEDLLDVAVMRRLMQRVHPERPQRCIPIGDRSSDLLWNVITSCWDKHPQNRPLALQVRDKLKAIIQPQKPVRRGRLSVNMSPHEILRYLVAHGSQDLTRDIGCVAVSHNPRSDLGGQHQYYDHWITGSTQNGTRVFMGRASSLYPFSLSGVSENATATLLTAHEGYILSRCNHPNIRGIMGVALLDDSLSLVFRELEAGYQRFPEVVWTEGEIRSATICKMAFQISDAVAYLHSIDIVRSNRSPMLPLFPPNW